MSGSSESLGWNACVHRLDLGLHSHSKKFWGNGARAHVNSEGKNPLYRKKKISPEEDGNHDAASSRTAKPAHYERAIPAPLSPTVIMMICRKLTVLRLLPLATTSERVSERASESASQFVSQSVSQ